MNTQLGLGLRNAQGNLLARRLDGGYLRLYDGAQPATPEIAVTDQTLLVELRFASTSAPEVTDGVVVFAAPFNAPVLAAGTATWFRMLRSNGSTAEIDGSVGLAADNPNLVLVSPVLAAGGQLLIDSFNHSVLAHINGA